MHGAVLLDAQDAVLRPAILWNDGRSAAECTELERREQSVDGVGIERAPHAVLGPDVQIEVGHGAASASCWTGWSGRR